MIVHCVPHATVTIRSRAFCAELAHVQLLFESGVHLIINGIHDVMRKRNEGSQVWRVNPCRYLAIYQ